MVNLVSGSKNEGKTTRLKVLFRETSNAAGFVSEKVMDCGRVTTYKLTDLRTGDSRIMARLTSLPLPEAWGEDFQHGPFRMSVDAFAWARALLEDAIRTGAGAFFIDELGKVELEGRGHAELIRRALDTRLDLYIAIRKTNVNDAIRVFGIRDHRIIQVS